MTESIQSQNKSIQKVTYIGMVVNVGLALLKIIFGLLAGSISLLADGFHSFSDLATDVAVLVGVYFGSKEPDHEHPYGHGRMETFSAAFVAIVLVLVGCGMIYKAGMNIARTAEPHKIANTFEFVVIGISLISVVAKELVYR